MANEQTCHLHNMEQSERRMTSSEEADTGPLPSNKPLRNIQIKLEKEIENLKLLTDTDTVPLTLNKPLIQKVPQHWRSCYSEDECKRYFKPISVAIGPLHHQREIDRDPRMERGEQCKLKLAAMFIKDSTRKTEEFYDDVKKEMNSLKSWYNLEVVENWSEKELAWMFIVDGCALLHFIVRDVNYDWERFSVNNGLVSIEKMDFFLLENQLPYRLLEILIESFAKNLPDDQLARNNPEELLKKCIADFINRSFWRLTAQQEHHRSFLRQTARQEQTARQQKTVQQEHRIRIDNSQPHPPDPQPHPHHFQDLLQGGEKREGSNEDGFCETLIGDKSNHPHHLLDLLRRRLIGEKGEKRERSNEDGFWETLIGDKSKHSPLIIRNVRELKGKGIHFKAKEKGSAITNNDFKDRCCMATLTLAPIFLHGTTVPLLLNLIAYELSPGFKENWEITSHLLLLESLIDNAEDLKELKDAGVLHNGLGSDEAVAQLLSKIGGILVPNFKVDPDLRHDIRAYCDRNKSRFMEFIHTYFRSTWSLVVFLSALASLIMEGMQTYYSSHQNKPH
ncbi:hypothetical protein SLEP1_g56368 [Rubroshorea leprosula]|uniref:Uncharacterized protein n=1 Tax=Rubroshorea leprosula TaxID=152421 RepID=A0AAV5MM11_9ROSI|nr:hypothetical protein SLEP1_g56368 [Rubroshorea leprosula]